MGNRFFPVSIDLKNKNILVVGAGKISLRKVITLLEYECKIRVITKEVLEKDFYKLNEDRKIILNENHNFCEKDLENIFLVIAATNNEEINEYISEICIKRNVLVNNISSKNNMSLRFSSIYEKDDFQIAVSAKGNPKRAVEIKNKIKAVFNKI